ncbi:hypothetical protein DFQ27_000247, partial [Actinomortierella ambigua]
ASKQIVLEDAFRYWQEELGDAIKNRMRCRATQQLKRALRIEKGVYKSAVSITAASASTQLPPLHVFPMTATTSTLQRQQERLARELLQRGRRLPTTLWSGVRNGAIWP